MSALVEGLLLSEVYGRLKGFIIKCKEFRPLLNKVISKIDSYMPLIMHMEALNGKLDHPKNELRDIKAHMEKGIDLVQKCTGVKLWEKSSCTNKLNQWVATLDDLLNVLHTIAVKNGMITEGKIDNLSNNMVIGFQGIEDHVETSSRRVVDELTALFVGPKIPVGSVQPFKDGVSTDYSSNIARADPATSFRDDDNMILLDEKNSIWMLGAKHLTIDHLPSRDSNIYWKLKPMSKSRVPEVAQLEQVWHFDIKCDINTNKLSPETRYAAYLVYRLRANNTGFEGRSITLSVQGRDSKISLLDSVGYKSDKFWMEKELVDEIFNEEDDAIVKIHLKDHDTNREKSGLIVEGIELRPKPA